MKATFQRALLILEGRKCHAADRRRFISAAFIRKLPTVVLAIFDSSNINY